MYERFTDRARKSLQLANKHACRLNNEHVGTEHILLGVLDEGNGLASAVLKNLGVDVHKLRVFVDAAVFTGTEMVSMCKLPMTPRGKQVLEYAIEEAKTLQHNYVGTEHILLGLIRCTEGIAGMTLRVQDVTAEKVREEIQSLLASRKTDDSKTEEPKLGAFLLDQLLWEKAVVSALQGAASVPINTGASSDVRGRYVVELADYVVEESRKRKLANVTGAVVEWHMNVVKGDDNGNG